MTVDNSRVLSGMSEFVKIPQSNENVGMETHERLALNKRTKEACRFTWCIEAVKNRMVCTHHVQNVRRSPAGDDY